MSFTIGQKVGDYEILEPLGAGGMGQVYKVRNTLSDRVEAMKVLLPNLAGQQELAARFLREIKLLASLDHPNIASLRTAQHVDNQLVMIMELVEGTTLAERLRSGPLPEHQAADFTIQVLSALSYAHARGIIHRDIKPANMMLMPNGGIKLMDFGIASAAGEHKLTQTGSTLGSAYYMSPEQVQAQPLDARSDLYSLGVSLYEMLTGLHPFEGDTAFTIMKGHIDGTFAPPRQVNPGISPGVGVIVLRAMARQPDQRYQTAQEFSTALKQTEQMDKTSISVPGPAANEATLLAQPAAVATAVPDPTVVIQPRPTTTVAVPVSVAVPMPVPVVPPALPIHLTPPVAQAIMAPLPPAVAAAAAVPPAQVPSSKRALYMILGSALTLAVIVLTAMRLPAFRGAKSDTTSVAPAPANAAPAPAPALADATTSAPAVDSAAPPSASATASDASSASATAATAASPAEPGVSAAPAAAPVPATPTAASAAPVPSVALPSSAAHSSAAPAVSSVRPTGKRADLAPAGKVAAATAVPKAAAVSRRENAARSTPAAQSAGGDAATLLDDQDVRFVQMTARATSMRTSYERLKREQAMSGYSPDPSLTAAVAAADQFLNRADAALAARDGAAAKRYLDLAEPQIVVVEKTFGR